MMIVKKQIALARFYFYPSVESAREALAQPGRLGASVAMGLLKLMAKRAEPGLLFWPEALSMALPRSRLSAREGQRAASLFFEWLDGPWFRTSHEDLEVKYWTEEDKALEVGGRRRLWTLALKLVRGLSAAGASPSAAEFNAFKTAYETQMCLAAFQHASDPVGLAGRMETEWADGNGRLLHMALCSLPWPWLSETLARLKKKESAQSGFLDILIGSGVAVRVFAEGRLNHDAARILELLDGSPDLLALRVSVPPSSTCLWESLDHPPALDQLALDASRYWGWAGALSVMRAASRFNTPPCNFFGGRPALERQVEITQWDLAISTLISERGLPDQRALDEFASSGAIGALFERAIMERSLGAMPAARKPSGVRV